MELTTVHRRRRAMLPALLAGVALSVLLLALFFSGTATPPRGSLAAGLSARAAGTAPQTAGLRMIQRDLRVRAEEKPIKGSGPFNMMLNGMYSKMQEATNKMKEDLEKAEYEGFSSDETVRVVLSGAQQPKLIDVTQAAVDQGAERLQELVVEASQDAYRMSKEGQENRMKRYFQDMGLPVPPSGAKLPF